MPDEALVVFTPSGKRGRVAKGTKVLDAARALGVDLDSVCGRRGICSKCQVAPSFGAHPKHGITVTEAALSPVGAVEDRYDRVRGLAPGRRLGCQAEILGDVVLDVPPESQVQPQVVRKRAEAHEIVIDPSVRLHYLEVPEPELDAPSGDLERLLDVLRAEMGLEALGFDTALLPGLQKVLRAGGWKVTAAVYVDGVHVGGPAEVIALWPGYHEGVYGVAIDIGSTTIAGHLTDLASGEVLASSGLMNPQIRYGEDVMSRVSHAMLNPGGAEELTRAVREGVAGLVAALVADAGIDPGAVLDAALVMNPVMHHLFLGLDPVELGQAPFALATGAAQRRAARDLGLGIAPGARVYVLPLIAGHVGADAAAVALSEQPHASDDLVLVVDVGTNAEILLGDRTGVLACSSPTGPAFEGAQISAGQRAAPGAIERVRIDPKTREPRFRVIGSDLWSDEPGFAEAIAEVGLTGICGSGIIEVVAEMRMSGIVDARGLIGTAAETGSARCVTEGRTQSYVLWEGDGTTPRIAVTNADVRAIQMAKAALYAGARLLMDRRGVERPERVVLAGAFGAHISAKHAMVLGMIPDVPLEKVSSAGNAAGTGARIALLNKAARREIERVVREIERVETAVEPRFQEHFVAATAMPNAAEPFAGLRARVPLPEPSYGKSEGGGRGRRRRRG
ncbi:MAG: drug:proton antiporter [Rhodobacterales bacterium]|nr:MAG: drug:proton antiporter [Rhodobacterales bacterium]